MIPKIIHYCWLSGEEYPQDIKNNIASWKVLLPDYEFILWDSERIDTLKSVWINQALAYKKFAFASDYIRLYAVYTYGGIYLDCDVEVLKSFDDLLELPYFIGAQSNGLIEAAIFGSEKRAQWLLSCMQHYENRSFVKDDGNLDMVVLPRIMKSRIERIKHIFLMDPIQIQQKNLFRDNQDSLFMFPSDYFSVKDFLSGKVSITENTYTIHHFNSSWLPYLSKIRRKVIRLLGVGNTEKLISFFKLRKLRIFYKGLKRGSGASVIFKYFFKR